MNKQTQEALKMAHKTFMQLNERTPRKDDGSGYFDKEINACKEALEQPAQEPVAEYVGMGKIKWIYPAAEGRMKDGDKLYTHPHQWQGLTDDEIDQIIDDVFSKSAIEKNGVKTCSVHEGFRAVEQALKEKNT